MPSEPSPAETIQADLIRRMTPGRRLEIAQSLYDTAWEIKAAALRQQHPAWSEPQIQQAVRHLFITGHAGA